MLKARRMISLSVRERAWTRILFAGWIGGPSVRRAIYSLYPIRRKSFHDSTLTLVAPAMYCFQSFFILAAIKMRKSGKYNKFIPATPPSTFHVDFCNIRGLHSNLNAVSYHLESARPALFFLTETQISAREEISYLLYPGYRLEHKFIAHAGVCVFSRDDICCQRLNFLEGRDLSIKRVLTSACTSLIAAIPKLIDSTSTFKGRLTMCKSRFPVPKW